MYQALKQRIDGHFERNHGSIIITKPPKIYGPGRNLESATHDLFNRITK